MSRTKSSLKADRGRKPSVAVVGAGIAGIIAARRLHECHFSVTVFEKARGVGGRMATRRTADDAQFDHGAQYFTVRDERFAKYVDRWRAENFVVRWDGRFGAISRGQITASERRQDRYVAVPKMNSICKHLAQGLQIRFDTRVVAPTRKNNVWMLHDEEGALLGEFDWIVVTAPATQAADLLADTAPHIADRARAVVMRTCWAIMVEFPAPLSLPLDAAFLHESPLSWIARNTSKPHRDLTRECWVLHAGPSWSDEHLEEEPQSIAVSLLREFWRATLLIEQSPKHLSAHRWRFSLPEEPLSDGYLMDSKLQVAVAGDWCCGARVEAAVLSGLAAAEACLAQEELRGIDEQNS